MFLIEDKNFLTEDQKSYIDNYILGNVSRTKTAEIPFFLQPNAVPKENKDNMLFPLLTHVLINRPEDRADGEFLNSIYGNFFLDVVTSFFKKNNIKYDEILRMCLNFSFNNGNKKTLSHIDHDYAHKQLIIYLNNCDPESYTVIKNNKKEIKIKPEIYKGVCFDGVEHYNISPTYNFRLVLVCTFRSSGAV